MAMTREQVEMTSEFHADGCHVELGVRGGLTYKCDRWRANGQFQPRPRKGDWYQPVKHGMYSTDHVTEHSAQYMHAASTCALDHGSWSGAWMPYVKVGTQAFQIASRAGSRARLGGLVVAAYSVGYFREGKLVETVDCAPVRWHEAYEACRRANDPNHAEQCTERACPEFWQHVCIALRALELSQAS